MVTLASLSNSKPVEQKSQAEIRASLITKHNVKEFLESSRKQKQLSDRALPAPFVVSTSLNIAGRRHKNFSSLFQSPNPGGSIAQWLAYLLPDPAALGLIPSVPKKISVETIIDVAKVNSQGCVEESGQWVAWKCWSNPSSTGKWQAFTKIVPEFKVVETWKKITRGA